VVGLLFVGHGTQKLFGWFGGGGIKGTGQFFEGLGFPQGRLMAFIAGVSEAGGGALLAFGLFTALGAAAIMGVMINAAMTAHKGKGLWVTNGGFEYPLVCFTVAWLFAFTGPGRFSLDHAAAMVYRGWKVGLFVFALAIFAAVTTLLLRRMTPATEAEIQQRRAA
jgi:putative oxidoreductase